MLDLCKPMPTKRAMITSLITGGLFIIGLFILKEPWIWGAALITCFLVLLHGLYTQALKLIRGEKLMHWLTGRPMQIDERQVRNDLIAVDIAWLMNLYIIMGVWAIESEGWLPQGIWPALVLIIGLIVRFTLRWLLDRYA